MSPAVTGVAIRQSVMMVMGRPRRRFQRGVAPWTRRFSGFATSVRCCGRSVRSASGTVEDDDFAGCEVGRGSEIEAGERPFHTTQIVSYEMLQLFNYKDAMELYYLTAMGHAAKDDLFKFRFARTAKQKSGLWHLKST